jgi:hypothetical protein
MNNAAELTRKKPLQFVGNRTAMFGQIRSQSQKKVLNASNYTFDPRLIAAIIKRRPADIRSIVDTTHQFHHDARYESLRESQFEALQSYYGPKILANPVMLAITICDSETTETTEGNDPTRYDVLHCLAQHFDALITASRQKGHAIPNLAELLKYANNLESTLPLSTFILGLSEDNREQAQEILNQQYPMTPVS